MFLIVKFSNPHQLPQKCQQVEDAVGHGVFHKEWRDGQTIMEFAVTKEDAHLHRHLVEFYVPGVVTELRAS